MTAFEEEANANELPWLAFLRCPLPVKARRCREIHSQRIIIPTASWIQEEYFLSAAHCCMQHFLDSLRPRMRWRQVRNFPRDTRVPNHPLWWLKEEQHLHKVNRVQFDLNGRFSTLQRIVRRANFARRPWARILDSRARQNQLLVWDPWILILTETVFKRYQMVFLWDAKYGKSVF